MLSKLKDIAKLFHLGKHETTPLLDGETTFVRISRNGTERFTVHTHECCDCGLEHKVKIVIKRNRLEFQYWRSE